MGRRMWVAMAMVGLLAAGCGADGEDAAETAAMEAPGEEPAELQADAEERGFEEGGGETAVALGAPELPGIGPSVIKNASLRVEVEHGGFKEAFQEATGVATAHGGFVVSSESEGERARRGSLVLRVPSDRFEEAVQDLRELGTVRNERIGTEDVGQEFVDLEARLRNLRAQEVVLLRLMDRAETIQDTIRVQRELTKIQLEVEQIEGRLRYLRDRTSFATISLHVVEAGVAPSQTGTIGRAWERALETAVALVAGAITVLGVVVPLGAVALVGWLVYRRVRRVRRVPAA
jgi:hypothetical protein